MRLHLGLGLGLLAFTLTELVGPSLAAAAVANCVSPDGSCEVSNNAGDFVSCECADGSGVAGGGGNEWAGLSEIELQPICDEQLSMFCGPPPPPSGIQCISAAGECYIDNVPEDSLSCECSDGSGGGMFGGMMWAGYSDAELLVACESELAVFCAGGPPPPPSGLECSSRLGECTISNEPEDWIECACTNGEGFAGGGGNMWAGYSEDQLLLECESQLDDGCSGVGEDTGGETGDTAGETGDTAGETGDTAGETGNTSTGGPGQDTGVDDSGGGSEGSTSGPGPGTTTSDDATEGASGDSDGGADGGGGKGGCSVAPRTSASGLALALLGLLGLGRRRRRAA